MEKYTANSMLEDSLKDASGDASPSVGQDAQDAQRDLADSVTLNSAGMASARPVLQSPSSDALSVDESNNEASLGGSGITLGESDYLPTASQFKASRSISEIPEETRSSAQCLVQVLNDFKTLKKFGQSQFHASLCFTRSRFSNTVNVTTPPAVVISPHVEGSKSIVDRSAISLSNSPTSDPSDTESPPPVTPPDSQTDEPHPIATKTVSILDFDLNNLNFPLFMGDSQCDDDDDDLSLSGLELVYPDDVC
jgi:hypothetical protein